MTISQAFKNRSCLLLFLTGLGRRVLDHQRTKEIEATASIWNEGERFPEWSTAKSNTNDGTAKVNRNHLWFFGGYFKIVECEWLIV
jgi:hypothetical protein